MSTNTHTVKINLTEFVERTTPGQRLQALEYALPSGTEWGINTDVTILWITGTGEELNKIILTLSGKLSEIKS